MTVNLEKINDNADALFAIGDVLYGAGAYEEAKPVFKRAAELENIPAMERLSTIYKSEANDRLSIEWELIARAAEGDARLQAEVGDIYGMQGDFDNALKWYRKAAEQGNSSGAYRLAWCLYEGKIVPQNYAEAFKWFEKLSEQNNDWAQYDLGNFYKNGQGVKQDYVKAREYYELSAAQGHRDAIYNLGLLYHYGYGAAKDLDKAEEYYVKAEELGLERATAGLAEIRRERRDKVFISYSHADAEYVNEFKPQLGVLKRKGKKTDYWYDKQLEPGVDFKEEIRKQMKLAKVAVMFISAEFLDSDFVNNEELPELLKAAEEEGTTLILLQVRAVSIAGTPFENLKFPIESASPKRPIGKLKDPADRAEVYAEVVDLISGIFNPPAPPAPKS